MSHFVTSPNTNIPGMMVSDKSDFSYKIRHYTHPTDTNGYRFFSPSLSLYSILTRLMCSPRSVLVTGGTYRELSSAVVRIDRCKFKGSTR